MKRCFTAVDSFLCWVDVESDRSRRSSNVFIVHCDIMSVAIMIHLRINNNTPDWYDADQKCCHNHLNCHISPPADCWYSQNGHSFWSRTWTHHQFLSDPISTWLAAGPECITVWLLTEFQSCTNTNSETFTVLHDSKKNSYQQQLMIVHTDLQSLIIHSFWIWHMASLHFLFPLTVCSSGGLCFPGK